MLFGLMSSRHSPDIPSEQGNASQIETSVSMVPLRSQSQGPKTSMQDLLLRCSSGIRIKQKCAYVDPIFCIYFLQHDGSNVYHSLSTHLT